MRKPPPLPTEVLDRVIRIARMDGVMVMIFAGGYAAMAALSKHGVGLTLGLLATAAGAMELHGIELLKYGRARGVRWMASAQLYLMALMICYATWRLNNVDLALMRSAMPDETRQQIAELGIREDEFLMLANRITYSLLMVVVTLYQGGMALYFWRRRKTVALALDDEARQ